MATVNFTSAHEEVVATALRLANPKADVPKIIAKFLEALGRFVYVTEKQQTKPAARESFIRSSVAFEAMRSARAEIDSRDRDTDRRLISLLGGKDAGRARFAQIYYDMRSLEDAFGFAFERAKAKIARGRPSDHKHLRRLFVELAREWLIGVGAPIRASKMGLNRKESVVEMTPAARAGAELRAFHVLLMAVDVEIDDDATMTHLLNYARKNASKDLPEDSEAEEYDEQQANEAA